MYKNFKSHDIVTYSQLNEQTFFLEKNLESEIQLKILFSHIKMFS